MKEGAKFWVVHVAAAKFETISASWYARRYGLSIAALYYWRRKLASNTGAGEAGRQSKFVALRVAMPRPNPCTLVLPSGAHLEMSALPEPEWLAAFGRALPGTR